jgi:lipoprotein-releasing system permease protein
MKSLEVGIAWRYLRSRRGSRLLSFITVIAMGGVIIGVSALIVIIGVMNGLQIDLREKILIGSPDLRLMSWGADMRLPQWEEVLGRVREHPEVVAAGPFVFAPGGIATDRGRSDYAQIVGIVPQKEGVADVTSIRSHALYGDFTFDSGDASLRGVVLGNLLSQSLGVYKGDLVNLISISGAQPNPVFGGIVPRFEQFEVTGIFETGMYEYDSRYAYVALDAAQDLAGLNGAVTGIEVRTTSRDIAPAVARQLEQLEPFGILRSEDWQQQNRSLFQALKLEKLAMAVILFLIVVVAAFNIIGTLTMMVTDKTREIGILRAMGMRAGSIRKIFFAQGLVIGVFGTGMGLVLGLVASYVIDQMIPLDPSVYFIDSLPVATDPVDVALIVLASMVIAAAATIYPALQAARLLPIEAIRHE